MRKELSKDTSIKHIDTNIYIQVTRPSLEEINKPKFSFIGSNENSKNRINPSTLRLRKLARDVSKEPDTFQRQKMLFQLAEESKEDVIGI